MDEKKSYIFYENWLITLSRLPDKEAGTLIKAMSNYMLGRETSIEDPIIDAIWQGFKPAIDENKSKWENIKHTRSEAGKAGANARWNNVKCISQDSKSIAKDSKRINQDSKACLNVTVNVKENVSPNGDKEKTEKKENPLDETEPSAEGITVSDKPWDEFWSMYGKYKKAGEKYAMLAFNNAAITTDTSEILAGLKKVIDLQWSKWPKQKMQFIPKAENWLKSESWKDDVDLYEPEKPKKAGVVIPKPEEHKAMDDKEFYKMMGWEADNGNQQRHGQVAE